MRQPVLQPYMAESWYAVLANACNATSGVAVAEKLGISAPTVYQVLKGTGNYGAGRASTVKFAERVMHKLGNYDCPHLSEQNNGPQSITSDECRKFWNRNAPISSPRDLAHWQACQSCPHRALAAPAPPRKVVPRKRKAAGSADQVQMPTTDHTPAPQPLTCKEAL